MNVIVSGGSIAGCATAAMLHRNGIEVKVYERSSHLSDRGAGVALPVQLMQQLIDLDLFDADIPHLRINGRGFWVRDTAKKPRPIWQQDIQMIAFNWATIYENLRRRVPDHYYFSGEEVTGLINTEDHVTVTTSKSQVNCDLLIAADGINSFTRQQLYPDTTSQYAGYIAWRGTILLKEVELDDDLRHQLQYFMPPDGEKGHLVLYPIPAPDYQHTKNILMNWLIYEDYSQEELKTLLQDKEGKAHQVSISKDMLTSEHMKHLHSLAARCYPQQITAMILKTTSPFLQVINDSLVPQFVQGRTCFIGDAGLTLRPHAGTGAGHALSFGLVLAEALKKIDEVPLNELLQQWNQGRLEYSLQQQELSKNMGDALVSLSPAWSQMSVNDMEKWWASVVQGKKWYVTDKQ